MRVLFVVTDCYPTRGACSNLLKKLFLDGGLRDLVEELAVLTLKPEYEAPDRDVIDGVTVYRELDWHIFPIRTYGELFQKYGPVVLKGYADKVRAGLEAKLIPSEFLHRGMMRSVLRGLKRIHAEEYDILVPMFGNYAAMAAVLEFTRTTRQKVVLYQVDPCSTNLSYSEASLDRRRAFEREMYTRASAALTMELFRRELAGKLPPELYGKLIPMELPLIAEPTEVRPAAYETSGGAVCLFSGLIYAGIRDPHYTLKLFDGLMQKGAAQLHFVGVEKEELPEEFRQLPVVCHGRQPLSRAMEMMAGADVLVNIGNRMTNQLPSKIFDYISQGKPIVNIYKNRDCPTLPYLENYPLALNLYEEEALLEEQREQLAAFLREHSSERLSFEQVAEPFKTCTPQYCAGQMYDVFRRVSGEAEGE